MVTDRWKLRIIRYFPNLRDIILTLGLLFLVGIIVGGINILFFLTTGIGAFLNAGYSMCVYEDPLLEILPIDHPKCSWVPINMLVVNPYIDKKNLKPGTNVCYRSPRAGGALVCHRIVHVYKIGNVTYYYIAGLHPRAIRENISYTAIYGVVIDKFPRGIGGAVVLASYIFRDPLGILVHLTKGEYI